MWYPQIYSSVSQGSVIGPQQHYLERMEGPMHREGFAFRQRVGATLAVAWDMAGPAFVNAGAMGRESEFKSCNVSFS